MTPASGRWIISAPVDVALVAIPFLLAPALALVPQDPGAVTPLWAFLLLVVGFDVAHVWATLYISYLDPEVRARRKLALLLPIPLAFGITYRLHAYDPAVFWTLLAYFAIYHFAAQHYGFVALYEHRAGEGRLLDRRLDKWTTWVGALGPVVWWHAASAERGFDWFGHGEQFLLAIDPSFKLDVYVVMALTAVVYALRQGVLAWRGRFNWGKNLWMLAIWASWSIGVTITEHPLVSLAVINLLHGIPFLALVWHRCRQDLPRKTGAVAWFTQRAWAFFGLIVVLALLEEGLWDGLLWGNYLSLDDGPRLSTRGQSLAVAFLAVPQIVHYVLDGFLWKTDGKNPDLDRMLGVER